MAGSSSKSNYHWENSKLVIQHYHVIFIIVLAARVLCVGWPVVWRQPCSQGTWYGLLIVLSLWYLSWWVGGAEIVGEAKVKLVSFGPQNPSRAVFKNVALKPRKKFIIYLSLCDIGLIPSAGKYLLEVRCLENQSLCLRAPSTITVGWFLCQITYSLYTCTCSLCRLSTKERQRTRQSISRPRRPAKDIKTEHILCTHNMHYTYVPLIPEWLKHKKQFTVCAVNK